MYPSACKMCNSKACPQLEEDYLNNKHGQCILITRLTATCNFYSHLEKDKCRTRWNDGVIDTINEWDRDFGNPDMIIKVVG